MTSTQLERVDTGEFHAVTELARLDPPTSFGRLYHAEIQALYQQEAEDVAHALLSGAGELRALANDLAGGRWMYQMDLKPELATVFADLPPDPALQLAPDVLDAEQAARDEQRRRARVLATVGQREQPEQVWAELTKPWVPRTPPRIRAKRRADRYLARIKRAVVAVLQRDAEEKRL